MLQLLGDTQHTVGSFVSTARLINADKSLQSTQNRSWANRFWDNGQRTVDRFSRVKRLITRPIFIKSCYNQVTILGNILVECGFRRSTPFRDMTLCLSILAKCIPDIKIAIAQRNARDILVHPIIIHAECTQDNTPIVTAQITIEEKKALGFQFKKHGIDELHDIKSAPLR